jgi:hypothetical protein
VAAIYSPTFQRGIWSICLWRSSLPFKPALHVNYQEAVLSMKDGLPKLKDLPKEFGGSGELLPD